VLGESVAQVQQFVDSGNAELGFVALAQVWRDGALTPAGSAWIVPETLHEPIRQDAVLLARGRDRPAARTLLAWLQGDAARAIILGQGYGLPQARR
jgi:molybdate transport system substrate-binding protein